MNWIKTDTRNHQKLQRHDAVERNKKALRILMNWMETDTGNHYNKLQSHGTIEKKNSIT